MDGNENISLNSNMKLICISFACTSHEWEQCARCGWDKKYVITIYIFNMRDCFKFQGIAF